MSLPLYLADLPASARELIDHIGLTATLDLIKAMPGIRYPIPTAANNNPAGEARFAWLVEVVGATAAQTLVRVYGGQDLYIPSCRRAILRARDRGIVAAYSQGQSVTELALEHQLCYRSVELILKKTDTTPPPVQLQGELFSLG